MICLFQLVGRETLHKLSDVTSYALPLEVVTDFTDRSSKLLFALNMVQSEAH